MPPAANLHSQLIRVCVSEPSSLSNLPEMFDRKIRFLTVRLRKLERREDDIVGHDRCSLVMLSRSPARRRRVPTPRAAGLERMRPPDTAPRFPSSVRRRGRACARAQPRARARRACPDAPRRRWWRPAWSPGAARSAARSRHCSTTASAGRERQRGSLHQLAHALEAAHEIMHGDAGRMDTGEIVLDEIRKQLTRAPQPAAELKEDGAQGVAGVHGVVEHLRRGPALAGPAIIGNEQPPDCLLRRRTEPRTRRRCRARRPPGLPRVSSSHSGVAPAGSRRDRRASCMRSRFASWRGATEGRGTPSIRSTLRMRWTRMRLISGPVASKRRSSLESSARPRISDLASTRTRSISPGMRSDRAIARLSHLSHGKKTLRTLAKCGRMCGTCRSSTLRMLLSWIHANPAGV